MYSAFDTKPVVWPSVEGMQHIVARFKSLPSVEQTRRMLNQERFVQKRIHKLSTTLIKLRKENREKQMIALMHRILVGEHIIEPLNTMDLNDLGWVINMHLVEINNKIETIKKEDGASSSIQGGDSAISMSNFLVGSSCRGVVLPSMFNFQGGASSSSAVSPDMFNLMVGPSTGHAMPPSMYNSQDGASSSNGTTPDMLNYQPGRGFWKLCCGSEQGKLPGWDFKK
ncbi:unnamed protein product [Cuscuta campestris]|uniref:MADS-box domain-containing protein n=1 Tax=Cuscuta campestris TaxID=132261 RepID=A0A484L7K2_9ASTE|nr:unnamed protein product [Cuscuta campestris]